MSNNKSKDGIYKVLQECDNGELADELTDRASLLDDVLVTITQAMTGDVDGFYEEKFGHNDKREEWYANMIVDFLESKDYQWFKDTDDEYGWFCDFACATEGLAYDMWEKNHVDWKSLGL